VSLEFPAITLLGSPTNPDEPYGYRPRAVLWITESESRREVYTVQVLPLKGKLPESKGDPPVLLRHDAMYSAFDELAQDVRVVSKSAQP
jgi:hypothetical protein